MLRKELVNQLADKIAGIKLNHPVRVGIDGVDTAGKTTLADELATPLEQSGLCVIRASIDGFHNPSAVRYKRGDMDPGGYYRDSFDLHALKSKLLIPLGREGNLLYQDAVFDFKTDSVVTSRERTADPCSVLLFDGVFLFRSELRDLWDFRIFVDISFETCLQRALVRDMELFGSKEVIEDRYCNRYIPGQKVYLAEGRPKEHADVIIGNNDFENPTVEWRK